MKPVPRGESLRWLLTKVRAMNSRQRGMLVADQLERRLSVLRGKLPSRPSILWIEVTNRCNLNCLMCERDSLTRAIQDMQWPMFDRIAQDALRLRIRRIKLNRFGEPLLHPDIHRMTEFLKTRGVPWVFFVSNATLLDETAREAMLKSGLDLLVVSIDGHSAATYERIRRGARLESVRNNVEELIRLRNKRGLKRPHVQINSILMKENAEEFPELIRYWKNRADFVNVLCYTPLCSSADHFLLSGSSYNDEPSSCEFINSSLFVLVNGEVTVCCADFDGRLSVGNIGERNLADLWRGDSYEKIRQLQRLGGFNELPLCGTCLFTRKAKRQALFRQNHEMYRIARKRPS